MCVKGYTVRVVIGVCVCVYVCVWWEALEDKPQVKDEAWQAKGLGPAEATWGMEKSGLLGGSQINKVMRVWVQYQVAYV